MSNVTAMRCDKDELYIRSASGAEWTLTRAEIQAIWQAQSGSPAQRKAAALQAVKNSMIAALGSDAIGQTPFFDFDPGDSLADLRLELGL